MRPDAISNNTAPSIFGAAAEDQEIGNKARGLQLCAELGLTVPPWFVIPAETARLRPWRQHPEIEKALLDWAAQVDEAAGRGWIVRSSTAIEDSDASAHAGEFRTERAASLADLIPAVEAVAGTKSRPPYDDVEADVIIQRYIPAVYAGVAFSC